MGNSELVSAVMVGGCLVVVGVSLWTMVRNAAISSQHAKQAFESLLEVQDKLIIAARTRPSPDIAPPEPVGKRVHGLEAIDTLPFMGGVNPLTVPSFGGPPPNSKPWVGDSVPLFTGS